MKKTQNTRRTAAQWLDRVRGQELNPDRVNRVYQSFDVDRGYSRYHDACRERFNRALTGDTRPLLDRGFEHLRLLTPRQADMILEQLRSKHELTLLKKGAADLRGWRISDQEFLGETLEAVLSEPVDRALVSFFASEYFVHWMTFTQTPPATKQSWVSFGWHCDRGPRSHLKIIVYLNSYEEHGGSTAFLDLAQTERVAARGYLFGWSKARTTELKYVSERAGCVGLSAHDERIDAGEGIVFQPSQVMHRGVSPEWGDRCALTLCLLPSPCHWRDAFDRGAMSDLGEDAKWHDDAMTLMNSLAP